MKIIFIQIREWLLHLFNVHCDECRHELLEDKLCPNCEYLKELVEKERSEKEKLQNYILSLNQSAPSESPNEEELKPIGPKYEPWHVRRARLESSDRERARQFRIEKEMEADSHKTTEQLEKELLEG